MTSSPAARVARLIAEAGNCWSQFGVSSWERQFLDSIASRRSLSPNQEAKLTEIERKVFPDGVPDDAAEDAATLRPTDTNWDTPWRTRD